MTYCPGPTLRETTVPPIGAVIVVDAAEHAGLLEFQDFLIGTAENPQPGASGLERRVGRPQVIFGAGELRLGLLQILGRCSLALMKIANALLDDLRQIVLGACLAFCSLCCDEIVLLGPIARGCRFPAADRPS